MNLVFLELETQGQEHIIEVGAVKVRGGKTVAVYHSFARPAREILPGDEVLFGVTNDHLVGAPPEAQVRKKAFEFIQGCLVVTFSLDPPDLEAALLSKAEESGFSDFHVETLELQSVAAKRYPAERGYPSLCNVAEYFGVYDPRTDSLSRAIILKKLYLELGLPY